MSKITKIADAILEYLMVPENRDKFALRIFTVWGTCAVIYIMGLLYLIITGQRW